MTGCAWRSFALPWLALLLSGCADQAARPTASEFGLEPGKFQLFPGQVYTPPAWPQELKADVYVPERKGSHPAVLLVHGGGWTRRSPKDMVAIAEHLAGRGFVAVNIAYRFAPAHRFPAQLHDLQIAMHWIRAQAPRFSIDPRRIGAFGYSSGAHLVSLIGVISDGDELDMPYGGRATRLAAVVAGGTPADLRVWPNGRLTTQLLGSTYAQAPGSWNAASPITHVSREDAPFFLYHGGLDRLVSADQSRTLKAVLDAAGVKSELHIVPYHGHLSMFALNRSAIELGTRFLARHLHPGTGRRETERQITDAAP